MATICPQCHRFRKRVEMVGKDLPQPDYKKGDRFPGEVHPTPDIYFPQVEWTCPECNFRTSE